MANVSQGKNPLATLVAKLFGFPAAGESIAVTVIFERDAAGEIWTRQFGDSTFKTRLAISPKCTPAMPSVIETFAPFRFELDLKQELKHRRLWLQASRWWAFGIPLPQTLIPSGSAYEFDDDGRFGFHIEIAAPLIGLIVRYKGSLVPEPSHDTQNVLMT